jgi:hypothetical protein
MSNTHYLLLITSKLKTVGVGDLNPKSTDLRRPSLRLRTTCRLQYLKPLNYDNTVHSLSLACFMCCSAIKPPKAARQEAQLAEGTPLP